MIHALVRWIMQRVEDRWLPHLMECEECCPPVEPTPEFKARVAALIERTKGR